jgi:hypothetical protein
MGALRMLRRLAVVLSSMVVLGCGHAAPPTQNAGTVPPHRPAVAVPSTAAPESGYNPPKAAKNNGCVARGALPDPECTPGAVMTADLEVICHQSTRERRHVSASVHRAAFTDYGLSYPQAPGAFEVDHLIPLELGGDNTIDNLWPEAAWPGPGFREKDRVENYLHRRVCDGSMSLRDAQRLIATDWLSAWKEISSGTGYDGNKVGSPDAPTAEPVPSVISSPAAGD